MSNISIYIILAPILLISLTIHEFCHGYVAYLLGDDTAKRQGRLTLNPIKHIDPIGLLMFVVFKFGWAKPVPINPYNFKNYKRDTAITAAAGPIANFTLAIVAGFLLRNGLFPQTQLFANILYLTIMYNVALGFFNLIPFPPLDGSKIIGGFLSHEMYAKYTAKEHEGMQIFTGFLLLNFVASRFMGISILGYLLDTPITFLMKLIIGN